jgi:hypothetical protein
MPKERVEILGNGRAAVIDDFRRVELFARGRHTAVRTPASGIWRRQDKGHAGLVASAAEYFREEAAPPPIPYSRLIETTRITLLGEAAIAASELGPIQLTRQ